MATNIDMDNVSGNMADVPQQKPFSFSTFATNVPSISELLREVRQTIRPWSEFCNYQNFRTIVNLQRLSSRILRNLAYFQMNYLIVCCVLILYCLITSPLILIVVAAVFYGSLRIRQLPSPINLIGRDWTTNQLCIALHVAAVPLLYLFGAQSIMFWVIGASTFIIAVHAIFYNIDAIVTEEHEGFLTETMTV